MSSRGGGGAVGSMTEWLRDRRCECEGWGTRRKIVGHLGMGIELEDTWLKVRATWGAVEDLFTSSNFYQNWQTDEVSFYKHIWSSYTEVYKVARITRMILWEKRRKNDEIESKKWYYEIEPIGVRLVTGDCVFVLIVKS